MKASGPRPTIKEVAAHAGVSPMTVSRTLAGGEHVRPDLQERVMKAVDELGYQRNENARSIRPGQSSGLIGVAITNIANPYYSTFALGVDDVVAHTGRRILLGNTAESETREKQLVQDFLGRRVDGLIVVPTGRATEHLARAGRAGVPVVLASRNIPGLGVDSVVVEDERGAFEGTAMLLDAGHTRIGYLGNLRSIFTGSRRFAGYLRAHEERGVAVDDALTPRGQQEVGEASDAMRAMLALNNPPTAVLCANNRNAIGAITEIGRLMREEGRTPDTLPELVCFDDFELSTLMPVPVNVLDHDARALGREAARLLLERLDGVAAVGTESGAGGRPAKGAPGTGAGTGTDLPPREIEMPVRLLRRTP